VKRITCEALMRASSAVSPTYCSSGPHERLGHPCSSRFAELLEVARRVRVVEDRTAWVDLDSLSARTNQRFPIGGLVGTIVFEANWRRCPNLVWGSGAARGKDVTKGNGWFEVRPLAAQGLGATP